ncbi:MAG: peptidylprolyl isomerase, partial [Armatimonadota bacterium]
MRLKPLARSSSMLAVTMAILTSFIVPSAFAASPVMDPVLQPYPAAGAQGSGPVQVPVGKVLLLPVTASDADNDPLKWITSTTTANVIYPAMLQNLPCLKMTVNYTSGSGDLYFLLLKDYAPETVRNIIGLVNAGYYDGLKFHRVIPGFMAQGGDKAGTGSGASPIEFDDEWNPNMVFTGRGQLAMANSGPDTNGTQFFVTFVPTRGLDFDHIIFGQLVRGWDVLSAIESKGTSGGTTTQDVIITKAQMVTNTTDAIARLRAAPNTSVPALGIQ